VDVAKSNQHAKGEMWLVCKNTPKRKTHTVYEELRHVKWHANGNNWKLRYCNGK
jgi:hypothetical protein